MLLSILLLLSFAVARQYVCLLPNDVLISLIMCENIIRKYSINLLYNLKLEIQAIILPCSIVFCWRIFTQNAIIVPYHPINRTTVYISRCPTRSIVRIFFSFILGSHTVAFHDFSSFIRLEHLSLRRTDEPLVLCSSSNILLQKSGPSVTFTIESFLQADNLVNCNCTGHLILDDFNRFY